MNEDVYGKVLPVQQEDVVGEGVRSRFAIRPANPWPRTDLALVMVWV